MTNGVKAGDCGGPVSVGVVLTDTDGEVFPLPAPDAADFFSATGVTLTANLPRDEASYKINVTVLASEAQSADEHRAMTASTGFTNVIADWDTLDFDIEPPICNVYAQSLTWHNYEERDDWEGAMKATFSGVATAE